MPLSSLLALIDDLALLLDDIAVLTKVAAKKTAGVLGDDLALNAQQVSGVDASRELPVVWAVAKGSLKNKVILVPAALAISAMAPWAVTPALMVGGLYLCFEGAEKIAHALSHRRGDPEREATRHALADASVDLVAFERDKIRGAVRTDFVLSAEIVAITLGTVAKSRFVTQVVVLSATALIMTVGVYGLVAGIVKLDDAGLALTRRVGDGAGARAKRATGRALLAAAPWLMKTLSVVGTAAMFLVGGGILTHGIHAVHAWVELVSKHRDGATVWVRGLVWLGLTTFDGLVGLAAGALLVGVVHLATRVRARARAKRAA